VLAEFAEACREHLRPDDTVGRYGGDEFAMMVPGMTSRRAIQIAEQLVRPPTHVLGRDSRPLAYTVSIGIAECTADGDLPSLLTHADLAMYEAKQAGGGGWHIFRATAGPDEDRQRTPPTSASALSGGQSPDTESQIETFRNRNFRAQGQGQIRGIRKKSSLNVSAAFPSVFTIGGDKVTPRRTAHDRKPASACPETASQGTRPCSARRESSPRSRLRQWSLPR
jgi:hypothetical protein